MNCSAFCPMLNVMGVCRDMLRRPEYIRECPHTTVRHLIEAQRAGKEQRDEREG